MTCQVQTANPYRAGKRIGVRSNTHQCTAGFTVRKGSKYYGMTAGHCGGNGTTVHFAGVCRGNIANSSYYASRPAHSDAAVFYLAKNASATMFMSTAKNYKVTGSYASKYLAKGARVCARGSRSQAQTCGPIRLVRKPLVVGGRTVNNSWTFAWDSGPGTVKGDSGAPVYRVISSNAIWAAGVLSGVDEAFESVFTPIRIALSDTGSTLFTTK